LAISFGLVLLAVALFFVFIDQALLAGLCFVAACFFFLARFLSKTGHVAKSAGKGLAKGVKEDFEKADTSSPDFSVAEEGFRNMADIAGQQMYAGYKPKKPFIGDSYQFKFKGLGALADASQKLIDTFKKVFR